MALDKWEGGREGVSEDQWLFGRKQCLSVKGGTSLSPTRPRKPVLAQTRRCCCPVAKKACSWRWERPAGEYHTKNVWIIDGVTTTCTQCLVWKRKIKNQILLTQLPDCWSASLSLTVTKDVSSQEAMLVRAFTKSCLSRMLCTNSLKGENQQQTSSTRHIYQVGNMDVLQVQCTVNTAASFWLTSHDVPTLHETWYPTAYGVVESHVSKLWASYTCYLCICVIGDSVMGRNAVNGYIHISATHFSHHCCSNVVTTE